MNEFGEKKAAKYRKKFNPIPITNKYAYMHYL